MSVPYDQAKDEDEVHFAFPSVPRPTRYQRIFRSPWTYLVLAVYFTFLATQHHQAWYLRALFITVSVLTWLDFWSKADKRWGKP